MQPPRVIILSGYGLNCEDETKAAFEIAGAQAEIVHINDLADGTKKLTNYQILAVPGGFSYGDDTGSGKAYANKLKNHLNDQLQKFAHSDKLIIGICNGFQILTQAGLLPGVLATNKSARYQDRWVDLETRAALPPFSKGGLGGFSNPWLKGISILSLPIAHGEGNYYATNKTITELKKTNSIALVYTKGEICELQNLEANPNGAMENIAAITGNKGKILGMMPHPERALFFTQLPHWTLLKERLIRADQDLPEYGPGLQIFKNAVSYFE